MPTCMFILTYICVVLERRWLTARAGRDRMLGSYAAWLVKLRECWKMSPVLITLNEPVLKSLKVCHECFCGHILTSWEILWHSAESTPPHYTPQCWEFPWDRAVVTQVGDISLTGSDAVDIRCIQSSSNLHEWPSHFWLLSWEPEENHWWELIMPLM